MISHLLPPALFFHFYTIWRFNLPATREADTSTRRVSCAEHPVIGRNRNTEQFTRTQGKESASTRKSNSRLRFSLSPILSRFLFGRLAPQAKISGSGKAAPFSGHSYANNSPLSLQSQTLSCGLDWR